MKNLQNYNKYFQNDLFSPTADLINKVLTNIPEIFCQVHIPSILCWQCFIGIMEVFTAYIPYVRMQCQITCSCSPLKAIKARLFFFSEKELHFGHDWVPSVLTACIVGYCSIFSSDALLALTFIMSKFCF